MEMYYYWLHNIPGIGRKTYSKIVESVSPEELFLHDYENKLQFLTGKQKESLKKSKESWELSKEWEKLKQRNIRFLRYKTNGYPEKLNLISDPPPVLYHKGKRNLLQKPTVAVIGARACSNYGNCMAKELGRELARAGIVVVSGMARGIDSICQWETLENGGGSIGVLGCGVEICYPWEERALYERLQKEGCLLSENPPFTPPNAGLFPLRNRIISGLADLVVVVEARERSGTLITVDMALEQGKEVYAIPGRTTDAVSTGCNQLIRQGAGMILSVEDFLEEICPILKVRYEERKEICDCNFSQEEQKILDIMDMSFKNMEEIYQQVKQKEKEITLPRVMELVMQLRMKKIIKEENGYYYMEKIPVATKAAQ